MRLFPAGDPTSGIWQWRCHRRNGTDPGTPSWALPLPQDPNWGKFPPSAFKSQRKGASAESLPPLNTQKCCCWTFVLLPSLSTLRDKSKAWGCIRPVPNPLLNSRPSLSPGARAFPAHSTSHPCGSPFLGAFPLFLPQCLSFTCPPAPFPQARLPRGFVFINQEAKGARVSQRPRGSHELSFV